MLNVTDKSKIECARRELNRFIPNSTGYINELVRIKQIEIDVYKTAIARAEESLKIFIDKR